MLAILSLCAVSVLSCIDEELTAPRRPVQEVMTNTLVTADTLCAKMQFTITSTTAVTTLFPNRTTCTTKLVLIRGQVAMWAQSPNRRLTLFVRLLNKSGQTLQMPVRLYLPSTGITVVAPAGTPASKVVPLNPDSTEASGGRIWFVGGTGTLAANDSTVQDTIKVNVMSPVTQARFSFQASADVADTSAPVIPNSTVFPDDSLHTVANPADPGLIYYRTIADVIFLPTTSGIVIRAFLAKYNATVVAGIPNIGVYTIQFPDPGVSWSSLQSLMGLMRAEAGVSIVGPTNRIGPPGGIDGRFPSDTLTHDRSSWINPSTATNWAFQAVRAPLAWGCETGQYGGPLPRVGVLEWEFESNHPDLQLPLPATLRSASVDPLNPVPATSYTDFLQWHGTATTGQLTAVGDNGIGIAGMMWRTDLLLYALRSGNTQTRGQASRKFAAELIPQLIADQPRVVTSQIKFGIASDTTEQRILRDALVSLFVGSPRTLFIQTAGDNGQSYTEQQISQIGSPEPFGLRSALIYLKAHGYSDRIFFVTGTQPNNQYWTGTVGAGATFIRQQTEIAAPASGFELLGLSRSGTSQSGALYLFAGTSFGAPMVAGVATQLLAMDSSLTPADLKRYILLGAQIPRLDSSTGTSGAPPAVTSAPEVIYQLDAYGSLQLLSQERPGTPVCGLEVSASFSAALGSNQAVIQRNIPDTVRSPSGPITGQSFSLAQGGRLLAVDNRTYQLGAGNLWSLTHTENNVDRIEFLEQDTAYISQSFNAASQRTDAVVRIGSSTPGRAVSAKTVTSGFRDGFGSPNFEPYGSYGTATTVSPTGDWVAVTWSYNDSETLCPADIFSGDGSYLVPLRPAPGGTYTFFAHSYVWAGGCNPPPPPPPVVRTEYGTSITWRSDGGGLYAARNSAVVTMIDSVTSTVSYDYQLEEFQAGSGISSVRTSSAIAESASLFSWAPEGGVLRYLETGAGGSGSCYLVSRSTSSPNLEFGRQLQTSASCIAKPVLPLLRRGLRGSQKPAVALKDSRSPPLRRWVPVAPPQPVRLRAN